MKGKYMLLPPLSKEEDVICMFEGLPEPFLLRAVDADRWQFVGGCYADELEPPHEDSLGGSRFEDIVII